MDPLSNETPIRLKEGLYTGSELTAQVNNEINQKKGFSVHKKTWNYKHHQFVL